MRGPPSFMRCIRSVGGVRETKASEVDGGGVAAREG